MRVCFISFTIISFLYNCKSKTEEKNEIPNFYTTPIINDSLVNAGKIIFETNCATCHTIQINTSKAPDISDVLHYNEPAALYLYLLGNKEQKLLNTKNKFTIKCGVNDSISKNEAMALTEYFKQYQNWLHEINSRFK
jgi:cytochrome c